MISNRWKILAAALPIIGTCVLAQPQPGGLGGFFSAWWGTQAADPYERLLPTAYWYPSEDLNNTDRILGIASTNTANTASVTTNGWEFNGTSLYLDMGRPPELEVGTASKYSMAVWVRRRALSGYAGLMGKVYAGNVAGGDRWFLWQNGDFNPARIDGAVEENATAVTINSTNANQTGVWFHVAMTLDRPTVNGYKLYIDGVQVAQSTFSQTNAMTYAGGNDRPFSFGAIPFNWPPEANFFNGFMDQAAVWNGRALTSNEVFNLFNDTKAGKK